LIRANLVRALMLSAALAGALTLAGCYGDDGYQLPTKAMKELSPQMLSVLDQKKMPKDSPILVRIFKEESELEVWKQDNTGHFQILKVYPICRWSGDLGPKVREGDRQAPEGFYTITPDLMNPNSNYYLAINTGFPNSYDKANDRHGGFLMIHGDCSSRGCYAMTDEQIGEIYSLARESFLGGQQSFQIQAYPFRMTPGNLARHRTNPNMAFWKMIKVGNDHFETTHLEPKIDVCDRHYVFDAAQPANSSKTTLFNPTGRCPAYVVAAEIAGPAMEKERTDEAQYAQLVRTNLAVAPVHSGLDGGMNRVFLAQVGGAIPPARVPPPGALPSQPPPVATADSGDGSLASKLFGGVFGSRSTQVAATDSSTQERGAEAATTGTTPKAKSGPRNDTETVAAAKARPSKSVVARSDAPKSDAPKSDTPKSAPQQTAAAKPKSPTQQEASAEPLPPSGGTISGAQPTVPTGSFDGRWGGLH
jgi:murein L,D-transpeptidase YafK